MSRRSRPLGSFGIGPLICDLPRGAGAITRLLTQSENSLKYERDNPGQDPFGYQSSTRTSIPVPASPFWNTLRSELP